MIGNDEREGSKTTGIGQSAAKSNSYLVYKLRNTLNGKCYIGITSRTLEDRWTEHVTRARQGIRNNRLAAAFRKYTPEVFERSVIAVVASQQEARQAEVDQIQAHDSYRHGYNANLGGHGLLEVPEEMRRRIGDAQRGKVITAEMRANMSAAKKGRPEFAAHLGDHVQQGAGNPRARTFRVRFPDGTEHTVSGIRAFTRDHGLSLRHLKGRGQTKGYVLLERFND